MEIRATGNIWENETSPWNASLFGKGVRNKTAKNLERVGSLIRGECRKQNGKAGGKVK